MFSNLNFIWSSFLSSLPSLMLSKIPPPPPPPFVIWIQHFHITPLVQPQPMFFWFPPNISSRCCYPPPLFFNTLVLPLFLFDLLYFQNLHIWIQHFHITPLVQPQPMFFWFPPNISSRCCYPPPLFFNTLVLPLFLFDLLYFQNLSSTPFPSPITCCLIQLFFLLCSSSIKPFSSPLICTYLLYLSSTFLSPYTCLLPTALSHSLFAFFNSCLLIFTIPMNILYLPLISFWWPLPS